MYFVLNLSKVANVFRTFYTLDLVQMDIILKKKDYEMNRNHKGIKDMPTLFLPTANVNIRRIRSLGVTCLISMLL